MPSGLVHLSDTDVSHAEAKAGHCCEMQMETFHYLLKSISLSRKV